MIGSCELKARVEESLGTVLDPDFFGQGPNSTPAENWICATSAPAAYTAKTATATNTWSF